jgi:hypothetical protein
MLGEVRGLWMGEDTYRGVVGDGFQIAELPAANPIEKFQPNTAT